MTKQELITRMSFGESIAENETDKLKNYFLQTEFRKAVRNGGNDIIYGTKGAGKSAIYTSIGNDKDSLLKEGVLISQAENPTGNTAFSGLTNDPPTTQTEFIRLRKLYFLVIATNILEQQDINDENLKKVKKILSDCDLVPAQNKLASILKACFDFMRSFGNGKEVSVKAEFDPISGQFTGPKFSISFGEPSKSDFEKGLISIEHVYDLLVKSFQENKIKLWILIDRLDVAFVESEELETNALRALFKTYLDLAQYQEIKMKIFLRDDIRQKITSEGFREASHITKYQNLERNRESLLNLLVRRILDSEELVSFFNIDKEEVLLDIKKQEKLFYRLFPQQIDIGQRKPDTIERVLSRTKDGKGINTPRELIQLFSNARTIELKRIENGINELTNDLIISRRSLKEAVGMVSKQRMENTLYAEFSDLKEYMESLRGGKAEHTISTLSKKWGIKSEEAVKISKQLEKIGFFEIRGDRANVKYKIPFIYRPYLQITQGAASSDDE